MGRSTIDNALDRYLDAASRAGAPRPEGPATERDLDAVGTAIAPLKLSDDVIAMWRRFQAPQAMPHPGWIDARSALEYWQTDVTASGRGLPIFPIAYESHSFLSAGLVGNDQESAIWSWAYDAEPARLPFQTLAVAFNAAADLLEQGVSRWHNDHRYLEVLDDGAWEALSDLATMKQSRMGLLIPGSTVSTCRARCRGPRPGNMRPGWI